MYKTIALLVLFATGPALAANFINTPADTQETYMPMKTIAPDTVVRPHALGLNLMIGNSGFGGGVFYRSAINSTLFWTVSFDISEAKAPNEVAYFNYWTGQKFVPGKINQLWVVPVTLGLQYRLFKDDLTDSFRPYVLAGVGPNAVFAAPYDQPLSYSFSKTRGYLGGGGYIGIGAYFGNSPNSLIGVSIRYYILTLSHGVESMQNEPMANFDSFFISFNIATQF